ncbi:hypothetical protein BBJ28_00006946, partial [Nothophytophthora sp. Chile5]
MSRGPEVLAAGAGQPAATPKLDADDGKDSSSPCASTGSVSEPEEEQQLNLAVHPSTSLESPACWSGWVVGVGYVLLLVLCAFLNAAFVLWPVTLLRRTLKLSRQSYKAVFSFVEGAYFAMLAGLLEVLGGVKIVVTTDGESDMVFRPQDHVLLISNHRSEVDWIFFWNVALRLGVHDRIRVMMKAVIRHAPGVGWAMLLLEYPFINRNWATDQARLSKLVASYKEVTAGSWLAMFPEGTALYDKTLQQSHGFAKDRGEPQWDYVLHPRVRGFELCADQLDPECIVDLTIAYPELSQGIRPSPLRFLRGQYPKEVHVHVQRFHRSTIAKHKGKMDQWLKQRFAEKEELLKSFYENDAFMDKKRVCQDSPIALTVVLGLAFNLL